MSAPTTSVVRLEHFSPDARGLFVDAQGLADRRGHERVEAVHLLAAALEIPRVADALRAVGVDAGALRSKTDTALATVPPSRGEASYLSTELVELIGRVEGERGSGLVEISALLRALGDVLPMLAAALPSDVAIAVSPPEPPPLKLIYLERYDAPAKALLVSAQRLADDRRHVRVEPSHLLAAVAARSPTEARDVAEDAGVDVERALADLPTSEQPAYFAPSLLRLLGDAERRAGSRPVSPDDLVRALEEALRPPPTPPENLATLSPAPSRLGAPRRRHAPDAGALVALLLDDDRARLLGRHGDTTTVAFDCGEGRNVRVVVEPGRIELDAVLEEQGAEEDEGLDEPVHETAWAIAAKLQRATGWHVDSEYDGLDPAGACRACGLEVFEEEARCAACGEELAPPDDEAAGAGEGDEGDDGLEPTPRRLASLAAPAPSDASPWHRPRKLPTIAELVALLLLFPRARVDHQSDATAVLTIAAADVELRVSVHRNALVVDELCEDEDEEPSDAVLDLAHRVLTSIQQATSWYAHTPRFDGFDDLEACGACPSCSVDIFRWQSCCASCETPIPTHCRSVNELVADAIVTRLLERELLVLRGEPRDAARTLVRVLGSRAGTSAQLLDALTECDAVDEVFADELAMDGILEAAQAEAMGQVRGRR